MIVIIYLIGGYKIELDGSFTQERVVELMNSINNSDQLFHYMYTHGSNNQFIKNYIIQTDKILYIETKIKG